MHDAITAAWLREVRRTSSEIKLDADTVTDGVFRSRSLFQGDPAAPTIFNCCLDSIAGPFHRMCQQKRWGVEVSTDCFFGIICFADNYWLLATSVEMLQAMTTEWMRRLKSGGFHTPHEGLTWCTSAPDAKVFHLTLDGKPVQRASRKVGFKALGVWITFNNRCEVEFAHRMEKAWRAFYANRDILVCRQVSFKRRVQYLETFVGKTLFWGAGSWKLTSGQRSQLRGVQLRMLRTMLGARRSPQESMGEYCKRVNGRLPNLIDADMS